jgi:NAD(P) transhydrogenase subunit alpha
MKISIPKQAAPECRVSGTPQSIAMLLKKYADVVVNIEKDAGAEAGFTDAAYAAGGTKTAKKADVWGADIVLTYHKPSAEELDLMQPGSLLIGLIGMEAPDEFYRNLAARKINFIALEMIPRTSRAQSMDVLSSQANIAGYRAVLEATQHYGRFFPLMMTSAGSAKPAKTVVLGAGVAGLQAIATARRLGAQVSAFDVRPEVKEQIESLGAKFLEFDLGEEASGEGGYAKALSAEAQAKQQELLQEVLAQTDVVITTAQIPGRPAPELITEATVKAMRSGSVIVDLAASTGGNCKLTEADKVVQKHGVTLVGHTNYAGMLAEDASQFYARNLVNLLALLLENKEGTTELTFNLEDDIIAASLKVLDGELR